MLPAGLALLTGLDLASIDDVAGSIERFGDRYLARVYTDAELADCDGEPATRAAGLAARFAAKEAVVKALGGRALAWREIEVVRTSSGRPTICLHAAAAEEARRLGVEQLELSMSHHGSIAQALVVGLRQGAPAR